MAATKTLTFVISDERKQQISQAAKAREITASAWLREAIREKLERENAGRQQ